MPENILDMPETITVGGETRQWGISVSACPALRAHHILGVGMANVGEGYCVIRHRPHFSHINVCLEGAGQVWLADQWTHFPAGTAGMFPREWPHGGRWDGRLWRMCWVLYDEPSHKTPLIAGPESAYVSVDPRPIEWALLGLYHEVQGANDSHATSHYAELIQLHMERIAQPSRRPSRLSRLWETVDANLAHPWTAQELASLAHMSEVHLRRLAMSELGRTPLQYLAFLRVRRADYLLHSHAQTVEAASWDVGYKSTSAFTRAFKRWLGRLPRRGK